jgi:hypothetical protein
MLIQLLLISELFGSQLNAELFATGPQSIFLREDASHFGDMSSSGKTVSTGNPRKSLDHQFKRLFAEAGLSRFR